MRHLTDAHGREWHVYEHSSTADSPSQGRRSLIFDADGIVRRLWRYPHGWEHLPDDALLRLMNEQTTLRRAAG